MDDELTLSSAEMDLLIALVGVAIRKLVWDVNAVYFLPTASRVTTKVETVTRRPKSPNPTEVDEAVCVAVETLTPGPTFHDDGEDGHWYRVVARDVTIEQIEIVKSVLQMPDEMLVQPHSKGPKGTVRSVCDCGVLVTTPSGVLPAVQLENAFGFHNWPEVRLHSREEVLTHLGSRYEIVALD